MQQPEHNGREPLPYFRIFFALVIASAAFSLIFLLAYSISYLNYQGVSSQNVLIETYLSDLDSYLADVACDDALLFEASNRLDRVGSRIAILESRFGKTDERVLLQKELYQELELKHFEIIKTLNEKCDSNFVTILFLYSNSNIDDRDKRSESMGYILSAFKEEDPTRVMIYSFDANLVSSTVNGIKEEYDIIDAPIAIVNEEDIVTIRHISDLEPYLDE